MTGGDIMEMQRMLLLNIRQRLMNGEEVKSSRIENGNYIVQLTNGPEIRFDEHYKATVDNTIDKAVNGVEESVGGNFVM